MGSRLASARALTESEGARFAREHRVPLWVGEFGAVYNGPEAELDDRLRALDDQLAVYEAEGVHWTLWTYKDCGVLGWVTLDPASRYMQMTAPIRRAKLDLDTDFWLHWLPDPPFRTERNALGRDSPRAHRRHRDERRREPDAREPSLSSTYAGALLQPEFAALFRDSPDDELDAILSSFRLSQCIPNERAPRRRPPSDVEVELVEAEEPRRQRHVDEPVKCWNATTTRPS